MKIKFTPKFYQRLDEISDFIYAESKSKALTARYIIKLKKHISVSLTTFPKLGRPAEEFGKNIRKLVHQRYTILYRIEKDYMLVITIYKENLPFL